MSQLKICDFSGETFKGFEFSMSATTTQLLSSDEFCKLRYDTTPVKSASANVSFYTNSSKIPNFELCQMSVIIYMCIAADIATCIYTVSSASKSVRNETN